MMIVLRLTVMTLFSIIIPEGTRYHLAYSNSNFTWFNIEDLTDFVE